MDPQPVFEPGTHRDIKYTVDGSPLGTDLVFG